VTRVNENVGVGDHHRQDSRISRVAVRVDHSFTTETAIEETLLKPTAVVESLSDPAARPYYRYYGYDGCDSFLYVVVKVSEDDAFVLWARDRRKSTLKAWPPTQGLAPQHRILSGTDRRLAAGSVWSIKPVAAVRHRIVSLTKDLH
jgi:hypothetical protein